MVMDNGVGLRDKRCGDSGRGEEGWRREIRGVERGWRWDGVD